MADTDGKRDSEVDWLARDSEGRTLLMRLVSMGAPSDLVAKAIAQGADAGALDFKGRTTLHHACLAPKPPFELPTIVSILVQAGADPSSPDDQGRTPLMAAFAEGFLEMKLLWVLASEHLRPQDPETRDREGRTLLDYTAGSRDSRVRSHLGVEFWARLSPHPWTLQNTADLAAWAPLEVLKRSIAETGTFASVGAKGDPILTRAISNSDPMVIPWLIKKRAPLEALDGEGVTPLARAASLGMNAKEPQIQLLMAGANWAAPDQNGATPFHAAVRTLNLELIGAYLKSGARASISDHEGTTPLAVVCHFNAERALIRMLVRSIPPKLQEEIVGQALVIAATHTTRIETVQALLELRCVSDRSKWFKVARSSLRVNPFLAAEAIL